MNSAERFPVAPKRPTVLHRDRADDWHWLADKTNPEVIALLEAENAYTDAHLSHTNDFQEKLFQEIKARVQETDMSVPVRRGDWWYYGRSVEGQQYGINCRTAANHGKPTEEQPEQILLDANVEAGDASAFALGVFDVSPDGNLLAFSTDFTGNELYELHIRDLTTGENLPDVMHSTSSGTAWSKDGTVLFYTRADELTRPFQVWRHTLGTNEADDTLVFEETDEAYFVGVGNSKSDDYISIVTGSPQTSEQHLLRADDPMGTFIVVAPRHAGIEYYVSHHRNDDGERLYILTNEDATNFRLMSTSVDHVEREHWQEVIGHRNDVKLEGIEPLEEYLIISERANAIERIALLELATGTRTVIDQAEEVYSAYATGNAEMKTNVLRFVYTSMVTPSTVFELNLTTGDRTVLKQQPVLGDFDADDYVTERQWATAPDGTLVPISIVRRKDLAAGPAPTLLYGYGAHEISMDPGFSSVRLNLLDRGMVFAIAHIRGGGDLGHVWYEEGRLLHKRNTFTDFIASAEHLIANGVTTPQQLVVRGGSSGGQLMGAVVNMRPDLFTAVVAEVPFVDTITVLADPEIPLTVAGWEEWGDPRDDEYYDYMLTYSPYDNVTEQAYPTMLVTGGLNDPRVSFWEPTKWVQKLRDRSTSGKPILLRMEMDAGHQGPSGRYRAWKDEAFVHAFVFDALGITE